jgi:hypothetical protein
MSGKQTKDQSVFEKPSGYKNINSSQTILLNIITQVIKKDTQSFNDDKQLCQVV